MIRSRYLLYLNPVNDGINVIALNAMMDNLHRTCISNGFDSPAPLSFSATHWYSPDNNIKEILQKLPTNMYNFKLLELLVLLSALSLVSRFAW